jgi:hypothetical protein
MDTAAKNYRRQLGCNPPPAYFCDPKAYGIHNHGRTVELATTYGPIVETENIAAQLELARKQGHSAIPFMTFWRWLRGKNKDSKARFNHLGPLGSYFLAADYTYTTPRLVDPPSIADLGAIICTLNRRAAQGPERLGPIPPRPLNAKRKPQVSTREACERGAQIICNILTSHLPPEAQAEVQLDTIMVEHTLCEINRAIGNKKFNL